MREWVYKATRTKVGPDDTIILATDHHLLCRSAYTRAHARPARVREVNLGDIIHFFYRIDKKTVETVGSFEVVRGDVAYPETFARIVPKTALFVIRDDCATTIRVLERDHREDPRKGYERDPVLKVFTGWALKERGDVTAPDFDQSTLFPGSYINLWHYPDSRLPVTGQEEGDAGET